MESLNLIKALQDPKLFDHPVSRFQVIETLLSWILLTGPYAYKIKKPILLDFVDYSSLEKRKYYCQEELKLNQALAGALYVGVIPIRGSEAHPRLNRDGAAEGVGEGMGEGEIIEYALKMHEFPQDHLLPRLLLAGRIAEEDLEQMGMMLGKFHHQAEKLEPITATLSSFGTPDRIKSDCLDNFKDYGEEVLNNAPFSAKNLKIIKEWTLDKVDALFGFFEKRQSSGFVRACHGDLKINNLVLFENQILAFDCIEFNPAFRFIDITNDIAFLTMDLKAKNYLYEACYFLNCYLSWTGDYEGLKGLRFYELYRAMVRRKVVGLSHGQNYIDEAKSYEELALKLIVPQSPQLILTSGVSGSGKTTLSRKMAAKLSAIHIRSDVERKRLFSSYFASETTRDKDSDTSSLYTKEKTQKTFERLYQLAKQIILDGYSVIVDAAFLSLSSRESFFKLAQSLQVPFHILHCEAPYPLLCERIQKRLAEKKDASDATQVVLEEQLKVVDPFSEIEKEYVISVSTTRDISDEDMDNLIRQNILR